MFALSLLVGSGAVGAQAQLLASYAAGTAISDPEAMVFDAAGNLYVANFAAGTVAKVAPGGTTSIFASGFSHPAGLAFDATGNLFVSDSGTISKVTPAGVVSVYFTPVASAPALQGPIALDPQGNLYACQIDSFFNVDLVKIAPAGTTATTTSTAQGSPCLAIAVNSGGDVYYVGSAVNFSTAHTLGVITKVTASGVSSQFAADLFPQTLRTDPPGGTPHALAIDRAGNVYVYRTLTFTGGGSSIVKLGPDGALLQTVDMPDGVDARALTLDSFGYLYLADKTANAIDRVAVPSPLVSAVLPGSRSVQIGTAATIFATILNTGGTAATNCLPRLPAAASGLLTLDYSKTDKATNQLTGQFDQPFTIAANGLQSLLLSFAASAPLSSPAQTLVMTCDNVSPGSVIVGVNTVDLLFSATPVTDVIVEVATSSNDGIVTVPLSSQGDGAFALATANVGAAGQLTVSVDTGSATLPVTALLCQSNPSNGQCLSTPMATLPLNFAAGSTQTFSVFVKALGVVPFDPAASRIFVRFKDGAGVSHGATSVAVQTR